MVSGRVRGYMLALICLSFFLNYADRQILGALIEPIKHEFHLSDAELGIMSGLGFGVFYALCSLPLARLADRWNRKYVLVLCVFVWSGATMLSGAAMTSLQLLLARLVVGVGEAGGGPAGIALISELFPPRRRGMAIAAYSTAGAIGSAAALSGGAWLATHYGWRVAFLALGLPGVVLGLIIALTTREPGRQAAAGTAAISFVQGLKMILAQRVLVFAMIGGGFAAMVISCTAWMTAFFVRSHGLSLVEAGSIMGLAIVVMGPCGQFLGGFLADYLGKRALWAVPFAVGLACLLAGGAGVLMTWAPTVGLAIALACLWLALAQVFASPTYGLAQLLVPPRLRATSHAVAGMTINLIGYGGGPTMVGVLSGAYAGSSGDESLRYAIMTVTGACSIVAAVLYFLAAQAVRQGAYDADTVRRDQASTAAS